MQKVLDPRFFIQCAALVGLSGTFAQAAFVYEGFDVGGTSGANIHATAGATSTGWAGGSTWSASNLSTSTSTYNGTGLVFGSGATTLQTAAGRLAVTTGDTTNGSTYVARQLPSTGFAAGDTVWGSYLFSFSNYAGGSVGGLITAASSATGGSGTGAGTLFAKDGTVALAGLRNSGGTKTQLVGSDQTANTTYMALFRFTNVNGASGSVSADAWILTSDQFNNFRVDGMTAAELNAALTGTGSTNVLQKVSATLSNAPNKSLLNQYMNFQTFIPTGLATGSVFNYDEVRLSNVDMNAVTPVPEPASLGIMTMATLVLTRRRRAR